MLNITEMTFKFISIITKTFLKLRLHYIIRPFENFFENLIYLSRFSAWRLKNRNIAFNDFPTRSDYSKRYNLYDYLYKEIIKDDTINYLEFGVAKGDSIKWWLSHNKNENSKFSGFDTFKGLPESWGNFKKGHFDTNLKFPDTNDARASFIPGLFQQTLPEFLKTFTPNNNRLIIHCDADLYSSTLFVLTNIAPFLKKDDIILFDEFNVPIDEYRAYLNFGQSFYLNTELIGAANNYTCTAFKVL